MKFKSLTKLAMSGVALAAVATTLGASTYAWYVVNPTASVTGVEASTKANGSTSILVSKDGSNFSGKIKFAGTDFNGSGTGANATYASYNKRPSDGFVPVTPKGATDLSAFYDAANVVKAADDETKTTSTSYLTFSVWVKSGSAGNVNVKLSAINKTGVVDDADPVLPTQYAYQQVTDDITATHTFTVDAIRALRTAVYVDTTADPAIGAPAAANLSAVYETDKIAYTPEFNGDAKYDEAVDLGDVNDDTKLSGTTVFVLEDGTTSTSANFSGAHLYYAQVMNEQAPTTADTATVTDDTEIAAVTLSTANVAAKLTFVIWLEGGDDLCFDACGGQQFEFGLQFDAA